MLCIDRETKYITKVSHKQTTTLRACSTDLHSKEYKLEEIKAKVTGKFGLRYKL